MHDCHRDFTLVLNDVASVLPLAKLALDYVKEEEVRKLINEYLEVVRSLSENIVRFYSSSTAGKNLDCLNESITDFHMKTSCFEVASNPVFLTSMSLGLALLV